MREELRSNSTKQSRAIVLRLPCSLRSLAMTKKPIHTNTYSGMT
ncbi:hypothetical protein [Rickettsia felis]|nr:hypothetical protein [Rickettsia felis]